VAPESHLDVKSLCYLLRMLRTSREHHINLHVTHGRKRAGKNM
jgi:hypothetical protein